VVVVRALVTDSTNVPVVMKRRPIRIPIEVVKGGETRLFPIQDKKLLAWLAIKTCSGTQI